MIQMVFLTFLQKNDQSLGRFTGNNEKTINIRLALKRFFFKRSSLMYSTL
jgi:hypothetical protein